MHEVMADELVEHPIDAHVRERVVEVRSHEASFADGLPLKDSFLPCPKRTLPPITLRAGAEADSKVGVARRWRAAKRMFSSYLLMQFAAGEPFQAGPGWRFWDLGVHAMAGML